MKSIEDRIENVRILITDDNAAIHEDFRRILATAVQDDANLSEAENLLFGDLAATPANHPVYALDFALQGQQAVKCVKDARADGRPYAMAFVDMRMPPGWDGLETIERLWEEDPGVQIVICSAHSDSTGGISSSGLVTRTSCSFSRSRSSRSKSCSVRAP